MVNATRVADNLGTLSNKVYDLLHKLAPEDRMRVMNAVADLFGDSRVVRQPPSPDSTAHGSGHAGGPLLNQDPSNPQQFFAQKAPRNKGEMLAVAARYREQHGAATSHTADDFARY